MIQFENQLLASQIEEKNKLIEQLDSELRGARRKVNGE
jgi:hypothetical protein